MFELPPRAELKLRQERFIEALEKKGLSGAFVIDDANVRYLSGFSGHDSALLITPKKKLLLTDFRYQEEAKNTAPGWKVTLKPPSLYEKAGFWARKLRLKTLAVERDTLSVAGLAAIRKHARRVRVRPVPSPAQALRMVKSDWEIVQIEKALRIQEKCFLEVCKVLKPGIKEYEAAAEMRYHMVKNGADDQSFDCMFQWGASSSLPHGRPTGKPLPTSCIVLIDWGAKYNGYHGDLTRTFFLGTIPRRLRAIHSIVMEAQARAIAAIAPGVSLVDVDAQARDFIKKAGFGKHFGHGTGHGLGLRIHEAPRLSQMAGKGKLAPGHVVTVEPGIYLPGEGGVRIEDDVLVTATGGRVLSKLPKGLRWNGLND